MIERGHVGSADGASLRLGGSMVRGARGHQRAEVDPQAAARREQALLMVRVRVRVGVRVRVRVTVGVHAPSLHDLVDTYG